MGYYTAFSISTDIFGPEASSIEAQIISELRADNEYAEGTFQEDGNPNEPCKWYDHEDDMREFSKRYPDVLFELHGEGEESGDIWNKYFKNGKMQRCNARIEFDDYDPEKLC